MSDRLIVVVDDDKISRMLPGILLRPYGITVIECDSGTQALEVIKIHHVRSMLIDISMPSFSGIDLIKNIMSNSRYAEIKLVAYTADSRFIENQELIKVGFHDVLIKPVDASQLLAAIGVPR